jgi:hypothetical protein
MPLTKSVAHVCRVIQMASWAAPAVDNLLCCGWEP